MTFVADMHCDTVAEQENGLTQVALSPALGQAECPTGRIVLFINMAGYDDPPFKPGKTYNLTMYET